MTAQTVRRIAPRLLVALAAVVALVGLTALSAGGRSVVTRGRLERSLPQAFANRYVAQAKILGRPGITARSLHARATCDKGGPKVADHGPGADWNCYVTWDDRNVPLPDGTGRFELNVRSNACYTASGPSKIVGLVTITDTRGNDVPNPVFEFDACFDPNSPDALSRPAGAPSVLSLPAGSVTPDASGRVDPVLKCSAGAAGGCAGTLTARIGPRVLLSTRYQLAPKGDNDFPFAIPPGERAGATLVLGVTPLIGVAPRRATSLRVSGR